MRTGQQQGFNIRDMGTGSDLTIAVPEPVFVDDEPASEDEGTPLRSSSPPLRRILVIVDMLAVAIGWGAAVVTAILAGDPTFGTVTVIAQTVVMMGAGALLLSASGLYRRRICAIRSAEVARIGRASFGLAAAAIVVLASVGRDPALVAGIVGGAVWFSALAIERGFLREWIHARRAGGDFRAPVLVVGGGSASTMSTAMFLSDNPVLGFNVRGVVCPPDGAGSEPPLPWLGPPADLADIARSAGASGIIVDANSLTGDEVSSFVQSVAHTGLHVHISSGLRGVDSRRISVSPLADETFLHVKPLGLNRRQIVVKRVTDVVIAGAALVLLSPVLAFSALVVWLYDRGPVFFRQERVGLDGERFTLFKLRSMVVDADARLADLQADNARTGPLFKMAKDPRVTPFGRFLRSSSIDELPQLLNVLEGTMSLVGPRPALPAEVAQFDDRLNERLTVKPGVTGLWQVEARDLPSFDLYRRYDLLYVQNWSVGLDLAIIARTAAVVAMRGIKAVVPTRARRPAAVLE